MSQDQKQNGSITGSVATGFESVKQLFSRNMNTLAERQAQLCVYYKGERVVDLWDAPVADDNFSADSIINIFSSGKSLETIAIASLVDKDLLSYDSRIADYWPEFAANGKSAVTVADLMRHESGLASFDRSVDPEALLPASIKRNQVGEVIEAQAPRFSDKSGERKRDYHAMTRGWIANELFRRVDPAERTIGEFLRDDISGPLQADAVIGVRDEELGKVVNIAPMGVWAYIRASFRPRLLGRRVVHNIFQIIGRLLRMIPLMRKSSMSGGPPPLAGMTSIGFFNEPAVAQGETPSANAHCSARGLAKIAAMMAAGGKFAGKQYLGEQAWKAVHDQATPVAMGGVLQTRFTQGGLNQFAACGPEYSRIEREFNAGREGFYGWMGLGGSVFQWHPQLEIGFAFVPTSLHELDLLNERGKAYQAEVLKCVGDLGGA